MAFAIATAHIPLLVDTQRQQRRHSSAFNITFMHYLWYRRGDILKLLCSKLTIFRIIFFFLIVFSTFTYCINFPTVRCLNIVAEDDFTSPALENCRFLWRRDGFNRRDIETASVDTSEAGWVNLARLEGDCESVTEDSCDDDLLLLRDSLFFSSLLLCPLLSWVLNDCALSSTPLLFLLRHFRPHAGHLYAVPYHRLRLQNFL